MQDDLMRREGPIDLRLPEFNPYEDPRPNQDSTSKSLSEQTVSEYLLFTSDNYRGKATSSSDKGSVRLGGEIIPRLPFLPKAAASGVLKNFTGPWDSPREETDLSSRKPIAETSEQADWRDWRIKPRSSEAQNEPGPDIVASASGGNTLLQWEKRFEKGSLDPGGFRATDTLSTGIFDPVNLYLKREQYGQDVARTLGAQGTIPLGPGSLRGGVERVSRPTDQGPGATSYRLGYEGKVGQGILGLHANVADIDRIGRRMGASGTFKVPIFGGDLLARAYLQRQPPLFKKYGAKNDFGFGFRWGKSF